MSLTQQVLSEFKQLPSSPLAEKPAACVQETGDGRGTWQGWRPGVVRENTEGFIPWSTEQAQLSFVPDWASSAPLGIMPHTSQTCAWSFLSIQFQRAKVPLCFSKRLEDSGMFQREAGKRAGVGINGNSKLEFVLWCDSEKLKKKKGNVTRNLEL